MNKFYYCEGCNEQIGFYFVKNNLHKCGPIVEKEKPIKGYWYKFFIDECVLCGTGETVKVRMYSPKPENPGDRYEYSQDVCDSHFM